MRELTSRGRFALDAGDTVNVPAPTTEPVEVAVGPTADGHRAWLGWRRDHVARSELWGIHRNGRPPPGRD
jgi:hypothetical protein